MPPALVTVWPDKFLKGWHGADDWEALPRFGATDLDVALAREYATDAHFVPYVVEGAPGDRWPRVNKDALRVVRARGMRVRFGVVVLDVDEPEAHAEARDASDAWREAHAELRENLPADLVEGLGWYDTRGGYRLLWKLGRPMDPEPYVAFLGELRRVLEGCGIQADPLKDWGRCYRLPRVTRDGVLQDRARDLDHLGVLRWVPPRLGSSPAANGGTASEKVPRPPVDDRRVVDPANPFKGIADAGPFVLPPKIKTLRNTTLTRYAGSLRRAGNGPAEILAALRVTNDARCEPPLPDEELEHIAQSVGRYDAPPPEASGPTLEPSGLPPIAPEEPRAGAPRTRPTQPLGLDGLLFLRGDDVEVRGQLYCDLEGDVRWVFDRGKVHAYDAATGTWREIPPHVLQEHVTTYAGASLRAGRDAKTGELKTKPLLVSTAMTQSVFKLVCVGRADPGFFDDAVVGLTFTNGFLTVTDAGEVSLVPVAPGQRSQVALPFAYDPNAWPTGFYNMLCECWSEPDPDAPEPEPPARRPLRLVNDVEARVALLQEWVGAALLGLAARYQRGLVLVGGGANGKSSVQKVVSALFPKGAIVSVNPQDMTDDYRRAELAGARLNCVAELPEAEILASEAVKAMISGDSLMGREIYHKPFRFTPTAGHLFSANTLPGVRDLTHGFWRRWVVLTFDREFDEKPGGDADVGIADRVIEQELAAVASWMVAGAARLVARGGFDESAEILAAREAWRLEADPVAQFVATECERTKKPETMARDIYNAFGQWVGANGHKGMSSTTFGKRLRALKVERRREEDGSFWALRLKKGSGFRPM